jgi:hypothetical protein
MRAFSSYFFEVTLLLVMWIRHDQLALQCRNTVFSSPADENARDAPKLGHFMTCPANEPLVRSFLSVRCPPKDGQTDTQFVYPT